MGDTPHKKTESIQIRYQQFKMEGFQFVKTDLKQGNFMKYI